MVRVRVTFSSKGQKKGFRLEISVTLNGQEIMLQIAKTTFKKWWDVTSLGSQGGILCVQWILVYIWGILTTCKRQRQSHTALWNCEGSKLFVPGHFFFHQWSKSINQPAQKTPSVLHNLSRGSEANALMAIHEQRKFRNRWLMRGTRLLKWYQVTWEVLQSILHYRHGANADMCRRYKQLPMNYVQFSTTPSCPPTWRNLHHKTGYLGDKIISRYRSMLDKRGTERVMTSTLLMAK